MPICCSDFFGLALKSANTCWLLWGQPVFFQAVVPSLTQPVTTSDPLMTGISPG
ncbi:hypothetical protein D3C83_240940 [compost metagenome]